MASTSAVGTTQNNPNYLGMLFEVGQNATPFLNMLGDINGARPVTSWNFAVNSNYALDTASQPAITEDASVTGVTTSTYARAQAENAIQIFQRRVDISYANESDYSTLAGVPAWAGANFVTDKRSEQLAINMRQLAVDLDYTLINGAYVQKTASNVASKTRGLTNAISTNSVDASAGALSKTLFNSLTKTMVDNGADLNNGQCVVLVNSSKKQELSSIFGLQERSNTVGGVNVEVIATDFGNLNVVYAPAVAQTEVIIADMSVCSLAVLPVRGEALIIEQLAKTGASDPYSIYGQFGLDHGLESKHGKLTNLA